MTHGELSWTHTTTQPYRCRAPVSRTYKADYLFIPTAHSSRWHTTAISFVNSIKFESVSLSLVALYPIGTAGTTAPHSLRTITKKCHFLSSHFIIYAFAAAQFTTNHEPQRIRHPHANSTIPTTWYLPRDIFWSPASTWERVPLDISSEALIFPHVVRFY